LVQGEGDWAGSSPPRPLLPVPHVTAHPSTASVPITVLLYNGPLLCGFNVAITITTTTVFYSPMCRIENNKKEKKLVVKKHNDRLPEKQKCSFKLATHTLWLKKRANFGGL